MMNKKVSIIIPVHNGKGKIESTARKTLDQQYDDFDLILVENGSVDDSWEICRKLEERNNRIIAIKNEEKGTSLARKKGIEVASGSYILFMDQDDHYSDKTALLHMVDAIEKDEADITQFAFIKTNFKLIQRKRALPLEHSVWSKEELLKGEIGGVMGIHRGCFNTTVWNKIYKAEVLKEAATHINEELYYAEDENLNVWAFISPCTNRVSVVNEAYYAWNAGSGLSSRKRSGEILLKDYETVKKNVVDAINNYCEGSQEMLWDVHGESLYCMRAVTMGMIFDKAYGKDQIIHKIEEFIRYRFIVEAKEYFNNYTGEKSIWDDLRFLASDYSAEEYYEYCQRESKKYLGIKGKLIPILKRVFK